MHVAFNWERRPTKSLRALVAGMTKAALSVSSMVAMTSDDARQETFPREFDDEFPVGSQEGNRAFFGTDVLRGLVDGVHDFVNLRQPRWRRNRTIGPALLGSAMWINDPEVIDKIAELSAACIVVKKQGRKPHELKKLAPLNRLNELTPGMPVQAFAALTGLAPRVAGKPLVVGPNTPMDDGTVPTIRTLGFRTLPGSVPPPILHAKLALLGHLWWHDEDGLAVGVDVGQRHLITVPARISTSARRIVLHLPRDWPWAWAWTGLFDAATGPPPVAAT